MTESVLFFRREPGEPSPRTLAELRDRQRDIASRFWRPTLREPFPPGHCEPKIWSYSAFHAAGLFGSQNYGAMLLQDSSGAVLHRSLVMPRFSRFPFMARDDLQIGATFTRPDARGQGLAIRAIYEIVGRFEQPARAFWYLTEAANAASVSVIKKAGFQLVGTGEKKPRLGLKFFGFYDITPPPGEGPS